MKRKIALLMATVMTMSIVPMNAFAASVKGGVKNVENGTLLVSAIDGKRISAGNSDGTVTGVTGIDFVSNGNYLELGIVNRNTEAGDEFRVNLSNAHWATKAQMSALATPSTAVTPKIIEEITRAALVPSISPETVYDEVNINLVAKAEHVVGLNFQMNPDLSGSDMVIVGVARGNKTGLTVTMTKQVKRGEPVYLPLDIIARDLSGTGDEPSNQIKVSVNGDNQNGNIVDSSTEVIAQGATTTGTVASIKSTTTVRDEFKFTLSIDEIRRGTIKGGSFEIIAPSGYSFVNDSSSKSEPVTVTDNFQVLAGATVLKSNANNRNDSNYRTNVLTVDLGTTTGISPAAGLLPSNTARTIEVVGIKLLADSDTASNRDVNLAVRDINKSSGITNQTGIKVGKHSDYNVTLKMKDDSDTAELSEFVSGVKEDNQITTTIVFQENVAKSWTSNRTTTFTLPEGVKVARAEITKASNVNNLDLEGYLNQDTRGNVTVRDNEITLRNLEVKEGSKASIEMELQLSIEPGFSGDVTMALSGASVEEKSEQEIVIAKAIAPITITTKLTNVKVGLQNIDTADIEIKENFAGALENNKTVELFISDLNGVNMNFNTNIVTEVTEGDLKIKNINVGSNNFFNNSSNNFFNNSRTGASLGVEVKSSSSKPSTIKFSNVKATMSNTVPNGSYDLIVAGSAVAENFQEVASVPVTHKDVVESKTLHPDNFDTTQLRTPYISTGTRNATTAEVHMTVGQNFYTIDGEKVNMDAVSYISPKTESLMVPVRFVANAFGISDSNITWSDADRTTTIRSFDGQVIQFKAGSDQMIINGVSQTMTNLGGTPSESEMTGESNMNSRMYLPFVAVGKAFGVQATFNTTTNTAMYNEKA